MWLCGPDRQQMASDAFDTLNLDICHTLHSNLWINTMFRRLFRAILCRLLFYLNSNSVQRLTAAYVVEFNICGTGARHISLPIWPWASLFLLTNINNINIRFDKRQMDRQLRSTTLNVESESRQWVCGWKYCRRNICIWGVAWCIYLKNSWANRRPACRFKLYHRSAGNMNE